MKPFDRPRVRSGEFEALALPLFPALYNLARWFARNDADAEDLVQETYSKALRGFDSFEQGSNFKAWIFRILRNCFLTSKAGLAYTKTVFLEDVPEAMEGSIDETTPESILMRLDEKAAIQDALQRLPPPFIEVLLLSDVEELKYREIATILSLPMGTVMSRLSRARKALRQSIELDRRRERTERPQ
ncbi:MAG: sigma-70 family RNA polymerase sigma factor [Acidobacteriaceae bacterium]